MKKSKLPFTMSLAVCCLSAALAIYAYWDLSHPPVLTLPLVAEPPEIDFGTVRENLVRGSTRLTNRSKKPLRLLHALVSCSCSEVQLKQGELLPGEDTILSASLDLQGRQGTTGASIDVAYVTEEGIRWTLSIRLRATVEHHRATVEHHEE